MMFDRTAKLLLALIVLGLWGLLLRPVFTPVPARAQVQSALQLTSPVLAIHPTTGMVYLATPDGNLYLFDQNTLQLRAQAIYKLGLEDNSSARERARTFINVPVK
jgi:hypothetical protein